MIIEDQELQKIKKDLIEEILKKILKQNYKESIEIFIFKDIVLELVNTYTLVKKDTSYEEVQEELNKVWKESKENTNVSKKDEGEESVCKKIYDRMILIGNQIDDAKKLTYFEVSLIKSYIDSVALDVKETHGLGYNELQDSLEETSQAMFPGQDKYKVILAITKILGDFIISPEENRLKIEELIQTIKEEIKNIPDYLKLTIDQVEEFEEIAKAKMEENKDNKNNIRR